MGNAREKELAILLKAKADVDTAFSQLKGQLEGAEDVAKKTAEGASKSWEDSMTKIRNVSAIAFAAVAGSIGFASKEAMAGEDSLNRVKAAVKVAGGDFSTFESKVNATTSSLQGMTRYSDEQLLDTLARMIQRTGDYEGSLDRLGMVTDVAAAFQIDVAQAGDMVSNAMQGELGMLSRLLPSLADQVKALGETATAGERAAVIMDRLAGYTGTAGDDAKTTSGSVDRLKNTFSDAAEKIGAAFLPAITAASEKLIDAAEAAGKLAEENPGLVAGIGGSTVAIVGFVASTATIVSAIPVAKRALDTLKTAAIGLANSPWLLVASGIIAVSMAGYEIYDSMTAAGKAEKELNDIVKETGVSYQTLRQKQEEIFGKFADYKSGTDAQRKAWDEYVDALRAAVPFMGPMPELIKNTGAAHKKAAEDIRLNTDAIRELMNAGLDFEAAKAMSQGAVLPTIDVEPVEPAFMGPIEDPVAIARYEFEVAQAAETKRKKEELWEQERQAFLRHTDFLQNSYGFAVNTMFNAELTSKQKRDAILDQFKAGAINKFAQVTSNFIFGELAKQAATKVTAAVGMAASNTHTATETANSAKRTGSFMGEAYAKLVAFYSFLGPFAPAAAVGTIGVAIAGIGSIIASAMGAMKFQQGGIVPGTGFGDKVPAWLEPGEFVMNRNATRDNYGALQAMNSGGGFARGGNQVSIHMNLDGQGLTLQRKIEIRDLVEEMLPTAIERALDDRRFSASYGS